MKDGIPTLCIGLPVRNGEAFLAEALDSALGQTFGDFELVVSDNASTDATADICRTFADRDRRIRYTRVDRDVGAGPNFNRVFGFCTAPYFKWMTHDDLLAPEFLARCMRLLRMDQGAVLAHTAVSMIDDAARPLKVRADGRVIDHRGSLMMETEPLHLAEGDTPEERFRDTLRRMNWCTAALGVIRSHALRRTRMHGPFYGGDHVLLAELSLLGRFRQDDEPLYLKRCHGGISVHMTFRQRARMMDPARPPGLPGWQLRRGYLKALSVVPLTFGQRLSCLSTVVRVSLRNPLLYRLLPRGLRSLPVVGGWLGRPRAKETGS
jgi:glycosyltransferase involved in cell wall biosynthesis